MSDIDTAAIRAAMALLDEIDRLRHWKAEANAVIEQWEAAWEAAGRPGELGRPKSEGLTAEIHRLRDEIAIWKEKAPVIVGDLRAENERLGNLAGLLATSSNWWENAAVGLASTLMNEGYQLDLAEQVMARHTADPADDEGT